jgi:hypothetical protein
MLTDLTFENMFRRIERSRSEAAPGSALMNDLIDFLPIRLMRGVFLTSHWNVSTVADQRVKKGLDMTFSSLSPYGVCDSPFQLLSAFDFESDSRIFCLSFVPIEKVDQPESGGWRWHKWGPYIGTQTPTCEYLADEPEIDLVWTYQIYEIEG